MRWWEGRGSLGFCFPRESHCVLVEPGGAVCHSAGVSCVLELQGIPCNLTLEQPALAVSCREAAMHPSREPPSVEPAFLHRKPRAASTCEQWF